MSETPHPTPSATEPCTPGRRCRGERRHGRGRRFLFFGALLALIGGLVAIPAFARGGGCPHGGEGHALGFMTERALDKIDATEAQREEIGALVDEAGPQVEALREEGRGLKRELMATLLADTPDPTQVEAIRQRGMDLADRGSAQILGLLSEGLAQLDGDQRAQLRTWAERHDGHDR
jgi:Spy/CpxP family protein refolding chaperone